MENLLQDSILVALFILGFHAALDSGMIFGKLGSFYRKLHHEIKMTDAAYDWRKRKKQKRLQFLLKPVIGCPVCMSSVYFTLFSLFWDDWSVFAWLVGIATTGGAVRVLACFIWGPEE